MGLGFVGPVRSELIGIWSHSMGRSINAGHVEVTWVLDVETCGMLLQYIQT